MQAVMNNFAMLCQADFSFALTVFTISAAALSALANLSSWGLTACIRHHAVMLAELPCSTIVVLLDMFFF